MLELVGIGIFSFLLACCIGVGLWTLGGIIEPNAREVGSEKEKDRNWKTILWSIIVCPLFILLLPLVILFFIWQAYKRIKLGKWEWDLPAESE